MKWTIEPSGKVRKQVSKLPVKVKTSLFALLKEIETAGPTRGNWPNYGRLSKNRHHCHLRGQSRPTYVAVWEVIDRKVKLVEVTYVGTHEKAPY